MSLVEAVVLGLLQGLTEFFPVSSSAHLELVPWMAGWDLFDGNAELENAFDVMVHVGTLAGAVTYLRRDIARYAKALWMVATGRRQRGRDASIALWLAASAIPAALVGVTLEDRLLSLAEEPLLIAVLLVAFGWLLWWSDTAARTQASRRTDRDFGLRDAVGMGFAQTAALLPGVSRSGVAMTAARWLHFERSAAARLAFLMSLPLIGGAGLYRAATLSDAADLSAHVPVFLVGGLTAAASSWAGIAAMLWFLGRADASVRPEATVARRPFAPFAPFACFARFALFRKSGARLAASPFVFFASYRTVLAVVVALIVIAGLR